jgi:hypothetical protein
MSAAAAGAEAVGACAATAAFAIPKVLKKNTGADRAAYFMIAAVQIQELVSAIVMRRFAGSRNLSKRSSREQ